MKMSRLLVTIVCCSIILTPIVFPTQDANVKQEEKSIAIVYSDYPYYSSIDALAEKAAIIIEGTVMDSRVEEIDERMNPSSDTPPSMMVYTVYTVKVNNSYKGNVEPDETIEIKQVGGEGETIIYKLGVIEDYVEFVENKKYVMFLSTYENFPADLLNPIQACYSYEEDTVKTKSIVENEQLISVNGKNDLTLTIEDLKRIKNKTKK